MTLDPNKLSRFWKELKRRRVIHVTIVYATAAVVIIDLVNNVTTPLRLPEWTPTLIIVILAIGFPLAIIFSWIFDVTPDGIEKTKPAGTEPESHPQSKSNGWKIASMISIVVVIGLVLFNLLGRNGSGRKGKTSENSIAILPVRNISMDPAQDPMCIGLTIDLINQLYKIKSFDKVIPPQSVLPYRNSEKSTRQIAEELEVNYILDLSYNKIGEDFTVTTFLVKADDDKPVWQDDYHRKYEEIITIPAEIALQIAGKLHTLISGDEKERIERKATSSLPAYELIQSVIFHFFQSPDPDFSYKDSIQKAIDLDPGYAHAYAVMALFSTFSKAGATGQLAKFDLNDAYTYNAKALELDPENFTAILAQAIIEQWINWNYVAAEADYLRVFSLAPSTRDEYLIGSYLEFLIKMERYEDALGYVHWLDDGDPREMIIRAALGQPEKTKDLISKYYKEGMPLSLQPIAMTYLWMEDYDMARSFADSVLSSLQTNYLSSFALAFQAIVLDKTGDEAQARRLVEQLKSISESGTAGMAEFNLGRFYSVKGEKDTAFFWLERAYDERCVEMPWLRVDPTLRNLRNDFRYQDLYERTGHLAYDQYRNGRDRLDP